MKAKYKAKDRHKRASILRREDELKKSKLHNFKIWYEKV